ncbi:hypothetical protein BHE74_00005582 [Ensete ventricosum]|nr:hypothetical protein GW17_00007560 [Ensete ventricosum]RWW85715.1 hypothetical protein BHE74_00005582 [Ensete ventricosum]
MNRKPGDWNCRSCQHLNFSRRDSCQRCGDPRMSVDRSEYAAFGGRGGPSFGFSGSDVRPGDWYCSCGAHNFASRSSCFKCGALKEDSAVGVGGGGCGFDGDVQRSRVFGFGGGRAGWKSGDWICNRCPSLPFLFFVQTTACMHARRWFRSPASPSIVRLVATKLGEYKRIRSDCYQSFHLSFEQAIHSIMFRLCRSGCNEHNFASRMECFRCSAPRDSGKPSAAGA